MRYARLVLVPLAALVLHAAPARAQAGDGAPALVRQWFQLNGACRGGAGDDPATQAACGRREAVHARLDRLGWCHGREGQAQFQMDWHRCGRNSIHLR